MDKSAKKSISAFWGDSVDAARQLVESNGVELDYLVADYLAEVTMGLLARASKFSGRTKTGDTPAGYILEFLDLVLVPLLPQILAKGIRVITNAGGLDPVGLKKRIDAHVQRIGMSDKVKVAAVFGDDILDQKDEFLRAGKFRGFDPLNGTGDAEKLVQEGQKLLSLNAYIGAQCITEALIGGANIIVTGRCVDSASIVGPLAFEHGWNFTDLRDQKLLDRLASASLVGHVLECGAQATGGNYTDWAASAFSPQGGWANMGYPIASCYEDGSFEITKPNGTGGVVDCNSVCEQMLYEVLDPSNYILPDVVLDLSRVRITQISTNCVKITGAKGKPPTPWLKCTAIAQKGFRVSTDLLVFGCDAEAKGNALGEAILQRSNNILKARYRGEIQPISRENSKVIIIGAERSIVPSRVPSSAREVVLRVCAIHEDQRALRLFSQEVSPFATSSCPGICMLNPGRPRPSPNFTTASLLIEREAVTPKMVLENPNRAAEFPMAAQGCEPCKPSNSALTVDETAAKNVNNALLGPGMLRVRLLEAAVGRSGDKGDTANVAIIARKPSLYNSILAQINPDAIWSVLGHYIDSGGTVTRYEVPGVNAINFVITKCLGGGGLASMNLDK